MNTNQHYISQCLIRRFAKPDGTIEKYNIKYGKWKTTGPNGVFSELGYNQLLAFGDFNNELDDRLKTLEDTLPETLKALDNAAEGKATKFEPQLYERLCQYCSFIWNMSPFSKAAAAVNWVEQIMLDCKYGKSPILSKIGMMANDIAALQKHVGNGGKVIITGKNNLQLVYRLQFAQSIEERYGLFRHSTKWTAFNSPVELPLADMALIKYQEAPKLIMCVFPISPKLVLLGRCPMDKDKIINSTDTIVYGGTLTRSEAEYVRSVVCLSGIFTVVSKNRIEDIKAIRQQAAEKGMKFVKVVNLEAALSAGLAPITSERDFLISPATKEEYVKFVHSFIRP